MPRKITETERLLIREFAREEEGLYLNLYADPAVTEFINKHDEDESRRRFAEGLAEYQDSRSFGRWAIFNRADNDFVGVCRVKVSDKGPYFAELGYVLHQKYWGKGIAGEMAKAIVDYAFTQTDFKEIIAVTMPGNLASQKVLEKTGFVCGENIVREGRELTFFRMLKNVR